MLFLELVSSRPQLASGKDRVEVQVSIIGADGAEIPPVFSSVLDKIRGACPIAGTAVV